MKDAHFSRESKHFPQHAILTRQWIVSSANSKRERIGHSIQSSQMKILVIGSGGREHALVWKLAQSPRATKILCAPGNAGIAELAECANIRAEDCPALLKFAQQKQIDLTVVGPDNPLAAGIVDLFEENGLRIFGPRASAARLESSKAFAKQLMQKYGIPTARAEIFRDAVLAQEFVRNLKPPLVIKADGLALGKGVIIARTSREAAMAIHSLLEQKTFGKASDQILIEECLEGQELSVHCFADGRRFVTMPASQDHKRVGDGDVGPNTGGMGAYSPVPAADSAMMARIESEILKPLARGLAAEGIEYRGVLYPGLMLTKDGPIVLEFNARFGDPETQVLLPLLKNDLLDVLLACVDGRLDQTPLHWRSEAVVCVVMASGGYPGAYQKNKIIEGLQVAAKLDKVVVFHAGTRRDDQLLVTNGGRVLGVSALGATIADARARAYEAVAQIRFEGAYFRRDIAIKALEGKR